MFISIVRYGGVVVEGISGLEKKEGLSGCGGTEGKSLMIDIYLYGD